MKSGVLITFEGVEGSGKTTQAKALADWLSEKEIPNCFVREPGGTEVGELIRKILLNPQNRIYPRCEVLLFLASRSQLVYQRILPAIKEKKVVVSDRFIDSTYAYQVFARNLPERLIAIFNRFACAGVKPNLTFLVDIDILKGQKRCLISDRMEREANAYHQRVRDGYLRLAHRARKRIKIIDGEKPVDALKEEVKKIAGEFLIRKGYKL